MHDPVFYRSIGHTDISVLHANHMIAILFPDWAITGITIYYQPRPRRFGVTQRATKTGVVRNVHMFES